MIRLAIESDIEAIEDLEQTTLNTTLGYDMLKDYLSNSLAKVFVLELEKKIVGYASTIFDGSVVEILNICINPSYQKKGLGRKLLGYIIRDYNFDAESFFLEVRESNTKAIKLYEYYDFKMIHTRKNYYKNENALVYERKVLKYIDLLRKLKSRCCEVEALGDVQRYYDDDNPNRYDNNFYLVTSDLKNKFVGILNHHISLNKKHLTIISFDEYMKIDDMKDSSILEMYSVINLIEVIKQNNHQAIQFNSTHLALLSRYLYNHDLSYGVSYASDNLRSNLKFFSDGSYKMFGVIIDNSIIGYARVSVYNKTLFFEDFEVDEKYQHKGIGSSIFSKVISYAKENEIYDMYLLAYNDETYKDMYNKMGFVSGKLLTEYNGDIDGKDKCD